MAGQGMPGNLKGYKLQRSGGGFIRKLILLIIIVLIVMWFVNKEALYNLYDWLRELIVNFF